MTYKDLITFSLMKRKPRDDLKTVYNFLKKIKNKNHIDYRPKLGLGYYQKT